MSNRALPDPPTPRAELLARVQRRGGALRRRRRLSAAAAGLAAAVALVGVATQFTVDRGGFTVAADQADSPPADSAAGSATPAPARPGDVASTEPGRTPAPARPGDVAVSEAGRTPPPAGRDCPAGTNEPTVVGGSYCGPEPRAGNGLGPDGLCTGRETAPPCGPGVEPGRWYPYTLAIGCDAHTIFNGQRWLSTLGPPPGEESPRPVWIKLHSPADAGVLSPTMAVGYRLDPDGPPTSCPQAPPPRATSGPSSQPAEAPPPR